MSGPIASPLLASARAAARAATPEAARPGPEFLQGLRLAAGRVHEICGLSRRSLAAIVAGRTTGPVFWIAPSWSVDLPHAPGLARFAEPGRFTFLAPRRPEDLFWCMEEVLRAGVVPLVVADLPGPPGLTPVRRLHLAAETGGGRAPAPPLGLLLTPEGGAQGVESRWAFRPRHRGEAAEVWRLERLRARTAPPAAWEVTGQGRRLAPPRPLPVD